MTHSEDQEALAAEYVLGTLDADERAQAQAQIAVDVDFAALVHSWERRLGELNVMVDPVDPPLHVWDQIKQRMGASEPGAKIRFLEVEPPEAEPIAAQATAPKPERILPASVVDLSGRLDRWRGIAAAAGALAATLALIVAAWEFAPGLLPAALGPPVRMVEVAKPVEAPAARLVAVLQKEAGDPGFLLTVDPASRTLTVRRVAAERQPGKSYELWLVSDKYPGPRSLGLVGAGEFTQRPLQAAYDPDTVSAASYAVSLEPEGGSPTGAPTGPVLFTGKLVEAVPPHSP